MDTVARDDDLHHQMDIYECIEVCDAETAMVDRQGDGCAEVDCGTGSLQGLHLLR